jgi:hypothetical protein
MSSFITTNFEISDFTNGIVSASIGLVPGSVGTIVTSGIQSVVGVLKYIVPVNVSSTGYVELSATNFVNQSTTFRENNFIIGCENGKKTNLVKYVPGYLRENFDGSESEMFQFVELFQNYLNTIYQSVDDSCNISMLEKIKRIGDMRNIDKIEVSKIPYYAEMLGYDVGINKSEMGLFNVLPGPYSDTSADYQNKCLRFVVGNLPNWYSIKTTRNAVKMMLLSFGIIGDVVEFYTLDYNQFWKQNRVTGTQIVSDNISKEWFSTPHISVGIDLKNSPYEQVYSNQSKKIINAMEAIRPANVVINGLQGYVSEVQTRSVNISMNFRSIKNINVTTRQQINIK